MTQKQNHNAEMNARGVAATLLLLAILLAVGWIESSAYDVPLDRGLFKPLPVLTVNVPEHSTQQCTQCNL